MHIRLPGRQAAHLCTCLPLPRPRPQDHLVRDMNAGRYGEGCTVVLCTHGLASRIFLQRWFHW